MAPVLVCPECGTKHPLEGVEGTAFPCTGCGRTLKVPEHARVAAPDAVATSAVPVPPVGDPNATSVMPAPLAAGAAVAPARTSPVPGPPVGAGSAAPTQRHDPAAPVPSRWVRFALWIVAVPLGFAIVFGLAKGTGVLNSNQITDVWLAEGWNRFVPVARLLPVVALAIAGLVQGGVYLITRWSARRRRGRGSATPPGTRQPVGSAPSA